LISLTYEKGVLDIKSEFRLPHTSWDEPSRCYKAMPLDYREIVEYLKRSRLEYIDRVMDPPLMPQLQVDLDLRDYQLEALDNWLATKQGVIVLPTGSGKTILALKAIAELNLPAMVVVPTLDLVRQWSQEVEDKLGITPGIYNGEEHNLGPITIATYDTAYIRAEELGNKFFLIVFDEVHHLPSPGYSQIAELFASPYRMGLTATYEREDGLHSDLNRLVGGKVYELDIKELSGVHLAEYRTERIYVDLTPEEREEYEKRQRIFSTYLKKRGIYMKKPGDLQRIIMMSGHDPEAREALLARNEARKIAINSVSKLEALDKLLEERWGERTIIFTEYNSLVDLISRGFLLPAITYKTDKRERVEILDEFKKGNYRAIVTSKVLDEGVDVPEASVGVILGGSGTIREYRQRLGRLLRKSGDKVATLYEIVSKETSEVSTSRRRRRDVDQRSSTG
jgi:superfamily II DNA or RNA helicase